LNLNKKKEASMHRYSTLILGSLIAFSPLIGDETSLPEPKDHKISLGILHLGYEYLHKGNPYAGVDLRLSPFMSKNDEKEISSNNYFYNGEARIGFNFDLFPENNLIAYLGGGVSKFHFTDINTYLQDWIYLVGGMRASHRFGPMFEMGLELRATRSIKEWVKIHDVIIKGDGEDWGMEMSVPFVWHLGENKEWEIQAEPFYKQMPKIASNDFVGTRLTLGYRF